MPRLAANLTWLFNEVPFPARFDAAARAGFRGVECLFPYAYRPEEVAVWLREGALELVLFNLPPGDWDRGDRGMAALPGREHEFREAVDRAIDYARTLNCPRLHAMAGVPPRDADPLACRATFLANIREAARRMERAGIQLLLEPINARDMPGYHLGRIQQALDAIRESGASNVALQMDLYHMQISEGDLSANIQRHIELIGHFQIASVPDRQEPDTGEVNYPYLLALIDGLRYAGWVGCEYRPRTTTSEGLGWAAVHGVRAGQAQTRAE